MFIAVTRKFIYSLFAQNDQIRTNKIKSVIYLFYSMVSVSISIFLFQFHLCRYRCHSNGITIRQLNSIEKHCVVTHEIRHQIKCTFRSYFLLLMMVINVFGTEDLHAILTITLLCSNFWLCQKTICTKSNRQCKETHKVQSTKRSSIIRFGGNIKAFIRQIEH